MAMRTARRLIPALLLGLTFASGACGGDSDDGASPSAAAATTTTTGGGAIDVCSLVSVDKVTAVLGTKATSAADRHPEDRYPSCTWLTDDPLGPSLVVNLDDNNGLDADAWLAAAAKGPVGFKGSCHVGHASYVWHPCPRVQAGVLLDKDAATVVATTPPPNSPNEAAVDAVLFDIAGNR